MRRLAWAAASAGSQGGSAGDAGGRGASRTHCGQHLAPAARRGSGPLSTHAPRVADGEALPDDMALKNETIIISYLKPNVTVQMIDDFRRALVVGQSRGRLTRVALRCPLGWHLWPVRCTAGCQFLDRVPTSAAPVVQPLQRSAGASAVQGGRAESGHGWVSSTAPHCTAPVHAAPPDPAAAGADLQLPLLTSHCLAHCSRLACTLRSPLPSRM